MPRQLLSEGMGNKKLLDKKKNKRDCNVNKREVGEGTDLLFSFCTTLQLSACFRRVRLYSKNYIGETEGGSGHPRFASPLSPNQFFSPFFVKQQYNLREKGMKRDRQDWPGSYEREAWWKIDDTVRRSMDRTKRG